METLKTTVSIYRKKGVSTPYDRTPDRYVIVLETRHPLNSLLRAWLPDCFRSLIDGEFSYLDADTYALTHDGQGCAVWVPTKPTAETRKKLRQLAHYVDEQIVVTVGRPDYQPAPYVPDDDDSDDSE